MNSIDPNLVHDLLNGATDHKSLITAIESYNDTHKLPYNKRIRYSIAVSNVYIAVLRAYTVGSDYICVIGWDQNGYPDLKYDENGKPLTATAGLSTHMINVNNINDVMIGGYDSAKIGNLFDGGYKTVDNISERELNKKLTTLFDDLSALMCAGQYRDAINKFIYEFTRNEYNSYSYEYKRTAYHNYLKVYSKYILILKDIVLDSLKPRVTYDPNITPKIKNKFEFVDNLDEVDNIIKILYRDTAGTEEYINNFASRKQALIQTTFTKAELNTFKQAIDLDHLRVDIDGKVFWTN
jgi:hypothetical protein